MTKDEMIRAAWKAKQPAHDTPWLVSDVFDDGVMVVEKDHMFRRVTFSVDGEEVSFSSPEEIMVKFEEDALLIFGLLHLDKTQPITVLEGQFDSLFIPNSIACGGTSLLSASGVISKCRAE